MNSEILIFQGSDNVFQDLGYSDAKEHQTKAKLVTQIAKIIEQRKMTQAETAKKLNIDQPKISAMLNGRFRGFSVYRLMCFISALGLDVEIKTIDRSKDFVDSDHIATL